MHNNYYFLRQLSRALQDVIIGTVISECFSQTKDELILRFETASKPFFIRASLGGGMSHLSFPGEFNRARKNSIDLFPRIIGYRVSGIRQFKHERSFSITLEGVMHLIFQMHGNRSNILLVEDELIQDSFKSNIPGDRALPHDSLDREIDWSLDTFLRHHDSFQKLYFTFGKVVWMYLEEQGLGKKAPSEQWMLIQETIKSLEQPDYFITEINGVPHLTLLKFHGSKLIQGNALAAANTFFQIFIQKSTLQIERNRIVSKFKAALKSGESYFEKNFKRLSELEQENNYRFWADLIMANLHAIQKGATAVSLPDFSNPDTPVSIKLKRELTPQANAAIYYRKAKNQHIEITRISDALQTKEKEIEKLKAQIAEAEAIDDVRVLRQRFPLRDMPSENSEPVPYYEFFHAGFRIWVGKNAQANDELLTRYAYKEDLWLHAKDVSGSHVIIKHQSGKVFPTHVIERAAQLAAFNSKRKTESLCPVIVTPRKFVRKRKGDPAGAVIVEREQIIMVEPRLE